jgi:hypothetical protein
MVPAQLIFRAAVCRAHVNQLVLRGVGLHSKRHADETSGVTKPAGRGRAGQVHFDHAIQQAGSADSRKRVLPLGIRGLRDVDGFAPTIIRRFGPYFMELELIERLPVGRSRQ